MSKNQEQQGRLERRAIALRNFPRIEAAAEQYKQQNGASPFAVLVDHQNQIVFFPTAK